MKKVSILFLSALALSLGSCGSDDNGNPTGTDASIVGKWTYSKVGTGNLLIDYPDHEEGCAKDYVELTANGVFNDVDYDSFNSPCEVFTDTGTYIKNGNTLTVSYEGNQVETADILLLTATELKIQGEDGEIILFTRQ
ncbi:hypothetical protein J2X31_001207 [Flavobacterium arsenatis]|uniref:Lipocalin-like domain-containing protein n=1 Tax=Flavobacterium arsenatis TaxID=1484332 RepID=A0ABU1TML3_9FLAO|nr:lipocalin family protein [Flavobacterium arsenatis]MDR6967200.1 hypothetical protein [Flavobacterium arsenatis]